MLKYLTHKLRNHSLNEENPEEKVSLIIVETSSIRIILKVTFECVEKMADV